MSLSSRLNTILACLDSLKPFEADLSRIVNFDRLYFDERPQEHETRINLSWHPDFTVDIGMTNMLARITAGSYFHGEDGLRRAIDKQIKDESNQTYVKAIQTLRDNVETLLPFARVIDTLPQPSRLTTRVEATGEGKDTTITRIIWAHPDYTDCWLCLCAGSGDKELFFSEEHWDPSKITVTHDPTVDFVVSRFTNFVNNDRIIRPFPYKIQALSFIAQHLNFVVENVRNGSIPEPTQMRWDNTVWPFRLDVQWKLSTRVIRLLVSEDELILDNGHYRIMRHTKTPNAFQVIYDELTQLLEGKDPLVIFN